MVQFSVIVRRKLEVSLLWCSLGRATLEGPKHTLSISPYLPIFFYCIDLERVTFPEEVGNAATLEGFFKTTPVSFSAASKVRGVFPKIFSMLLVRQEVMGNDFSSVATVLKSDVKREGVQNFISWC